MAKTLLLGRAGAGKTLRLLRETARRVREGTDDRALLLVPTYGRGEHLKRALLRVDEALPGFLDRTVVTFTSLAERVLGGTAIAALVRPGTRDHLLRGALDRAGVPVFDRVAGFPGFRASLLALVKEVKESGLDDGDAIAALEALARSTPGAAARARLEGFAAVFREHGAALRQGGFLDHEDFQRHLLGSLRSGERLPPPLDRLEWLGVDGFVNFTRLQLEVVDLLAARAAEAVLTLPDDPGRPALFESSRETRERFLSMGWRTERLGGSRRAAPGAGDLARLEAALSSDATAAAAPPDGSVRLLRCADPADEADRTARTAALWIRRDGWRPGEILLVRRSLAAARPLLEEAFRRHGIPLRVFAARPLTAEPVVRTAMDLLRLRLGLADGETALRAVRSGHTTGADPTEGDRLADLVAEKGTPETAAGIRDLARESGLRATAVLLGRLLPEDPAAAAAPWPPGRLAGGALDGIRVPGSLRPAWIPREGEGIGDLDPDRASGEAAALATLADLVVAAARSLRRDGESVVAPAAFFAALEEAVAVGTFAPLDRRLHAVNAVDAEEARQWEARGAIVGGLVEREFPRAPREDLFLRDSDRRRANEDGRLRFAERLRCRDDERLLFYAAATRARERLVLSWPAASAEGARLLPSSFLDEVLRLWPDEARPISESRAADPAPLPDEVLDPEDLLRGALLRVAEPVLPGTVPAVRARAAGALLDALAAREKGRRSALLSDAAALALDPEPILRRRRLRAPLVSPFRTSASALSEFHQCPYLHFANRVLRLRSPARDAEEGLDPMRLGTVVHAALERWFRGGWAEDPGAVFDGALAEALRGVRPGLDDHALAVRARDLFVAFARFERARVEARAPLAPAEFEAAFGLPREGSAPPLRIREGGRRIEVAGAFDRVDRAPDGTAVAVDYKMRFRERPFDEEALEEARAGADPQVPLYFLALRDALGARPLGVEIAEVGTRLVTGLRGPGAPESVAPDARAAAVDEEGLAGLERDVRAAAGRAAEALLRGDIATRPADRDRCGAGRCEFADLCRYEKWDPARRGGS